MLHVFETRFAICHEGQAMIARRSACEHACSAVCTMGFVRSADSIVQPAKLPNTYARKGTSVRQTDRIHVANVDLSFRRSVVPLIGLATSLRALGVAMLRSTRSDFGTKPRCWATRKRPTARADSDLT